MNKKWKKTLEYIKLGAETFTAVWPILKMVFISAGSFLVAVMIVNTAKKDEMDTYIAQYNEYKKKADSTAAYAENLKVAIAKQQQEASVAISKANTLGNQVASLRVATVDLRSRRDSLLQETKNAKTVTDSLNHIAETVIVQDSIIVKQDTTIQKQDSQIQQLHVAIIHKDTTIQLLTTSRDSLLAVIKQTPEAPKNTNRTFLGVKMPSRKTSLFVGAIVGAVSTAVILK